MKLIFLSLFFLSISCSDLFLPNTIPENFTSCQNNSIIKINQTFAMSQPIKGSNITFILLGSVTGLVQMKQVELAVFLEGMSITTFTYPDSSVFSPGETFEYKFVQLIPSYAPSGTYTLHFEFMDVSGNQDGCTQVIYTLD